MSETPEERLADASNNLHKLLGTKEPTHEELDPNFKPFLGKKVVVVKKDGTRITGMLQHFGWWERASIVVKHKCTDLQWGDVKKIVEWQEPPTKLQANQIILGHFYRGVRPGMLFGGGSDDREVLHIGGNRAQYDSDAIPDGRHFPTVTMEKFLRWAGADVTEEWNAKFAAEKQRQEEKQRTVEAEAKALEESRS